jgi:CRISPR-associated protein Csc1
MHIYRCELTLMEPTFFSSREVSAYYQTEPLIGNIALAYAFGFCQAPYFNDGIIHYREHLTTLNERGVYVTPATIVGEPRFSLGQFNAQADAYWYAFANNVIVTRPDGTWAEKRGAAWYIHWPDGQRQKVGLENRPQHGRIRYLAIGNRAVGYVLSREPLRLPSYIRLGKFMSKAQVATEEVRHQVVETQGVQVPFLLNPADLPPEAALGVFDLISVPPTPLVRNAVLSGRFYRLADGTMLPVGMRFGVEGLAE